MIYWLASYPKSGNTWVRMLVRHYAEISGHGVDAQHGDNAPYWYQVVSPVPVGDLSLQEEVQIRGAALAHLQSFVTKPTLVKTHHSCSRVNGVPLFSSIWTTGIVYVVRDPRDVVASLQNHMGHESRDEAIHYMAQEKALITEEGKTAHIIGSWSAHVKSWTGDTQEITDPLVVRYEDLHEDTERELVRVLEYMGDEPDNEAVERAVKLCRFERLKGREEEVEFPEVSPHAEDGFFRRGEVGGHRDELTAEQIARVERDHGEQMERMGYELEAVAVGAA